MNEKRGSQFLKRLDRYVGWVILFLLSSALRIKHLFKSSVRVSGAPILLVCFGAIGDLIVLTTAARRVFADKQVYLACSGLNYPCAALFDDFYADVAVIDLRQPASVLAACRRFRIGHIIDSTQWANIGPIQAGFAALFGEAITCRGFKTPSFVRNWTYDEVVSHSAVIHEVCNFINLMEGREGITTNAQLPILLPFLYEHQARPRTGKVLFHMWPSGNRSYLKAWPESYWQEIAAYLVAQGYTVCLSGAPADKLKTQDFIERSGLPLVNLAGTLDLKSLLRFLEGEIEFAVSVNTGILHLLVEAAVPVIGLHGGVNPERWGALGNRSISLLPASGRSAYLNYGFEYPESDEEAYVLDKLTVAQVIDAVKILLRHG